MSVNPALNVNALARNKDPSAPPRINALYLRDGKYDQDEAMGRANVAATFEAFRQQTAVNRLALFFHGGLVQKADGQTAATHDYNAYKDDAFPLFFIWESGIWELLAHHLPLVFAETVFGRVLAHAIDILDPKFSRSGPQLGVDRSIPKELASASIPGTDRASIDLTAADIDAFMMAIKDDVQIQQEVAAIALTSRGLETLLNRGAGGRTLQLSPRTYLSPETVSAILGSYVQASARNRSEADTLDELSFDPIGALQAAWAVAKLSVPVLINSIERLSANRDHGLICTVVEEILRALYLANTGSAIWEEMKRETLEAFGADSNVYGGTAVIEELCTLLKDRPQTPITLVGHSTGAIYIGNFLTHLDAALAAKGDTATSVDIILLAPASTVEFHTASYSRRVRGIRIFQMDDATEQQDHLMSKDAGPEDPSILGKVYPRSLLYLVSGICEYFEGPGLEGPHRFDGEDMPILGMARFWDQTAVFTADKYPDIASVRTQFTVAPPAHPSKFVRVLSPTATTPDDGFRSTATKHGNFPCDDPTIKSIRKCFLNGL